MFEKTRVTRGLAVAAVAVGATLTAGLGSAVAASPAAPTALQQQVDSALKAQPGSVQTAPNVISWDHGNARMVFPLPGPNHATPTKSDAIAPAETHGCPSGWWCFYRYQDFGGRMLQYHDCFRQTFPRSFDNKASSWVNTTSNRIYAHRIAGGNGDILWKESSSSQDNAVASNVDNRATSFTCYR